MQLSLALKTSVLFFSCVFYHFSSSDMSSRVSNHSFLKLLRFDICRLFLNKRSKPTLQSGIFSKSPFLNNKKKALKSRRLVCSNVWAPQITCCWKMDVCFESDGLWHATGYRLPHMPALLTDILDAIPPPESRGVAVTWGLVRHRCRWAPRFKKTGWMGQSSGKMEGNDRGRCPQLMMSTPLCDSECSAFVRLTTLVPYFNVRWLIYRRDRLAGGRALKALESINLMFQWFIWWGSLWRLSVTFPLVFVIEYWLFLTLIILPIPIIFLSQPFRPRHQSHWTVVILNNGLPDFWSCWMAKCQYWLHLTAVDKQKCVVSVPRTKLRSRRQRTKHT